MSQVRYRGRSHHSLNDLYPNFFHFIRVEFYPFDSFGFHGRGRVVVNHDGLGRRKALAEKQRAATLQKGVKNPEMEDTLLEKALQEENSCAEIQETLMDYQENLLGVADDVHPFSIVDNTCTDVEKVISGLEIRAQAFEKIAHEQKIVDSKQIMNKFRNQFKGLATNIEFWWLWVTEILTDLAIDDETQHWLTHTLLPVVYWHHQLHKTKNPKQRVKYQQAWRRAVNTLQSDTLTATLPASELERWLTWAEWMTRQFHRSSSAVEGRNGFLSQMHHNGRGLTEKRLRAFGHS